MEFYDRLTKVTLCHTTLFTIKDKRTFPEESNSVALPHVRVMSILWDHWLGFR